MCKSSDRTSISELAENQLYQSGEVGQKMEAKGHEMMAR